MPVPWITAADTQDPTDPVAEWAADAASRILYKLSGEKYAGIESATEYYSLENLSSANYGSQIMRGRIHSTSRRGTQGMNKLRLRHTPIVSVESVYIGNDLLPAEAYEVRNYAYLVRKNRMPWIADPLNEIKVTYTHGSPPPKAGVMAAIRLANEFMWAENDPDRCSLPERISSSINRQGVSYTVLDPQDFLKEGKVGIYSIDLFLKSVNPSNAKKRPRVFSPDKPRGERAN